MCIINKKKPRLDVLMIFRGNRFLWYICDGFFCENSERLNTVDYFWLFLQKVLPYRSSHFQMSFIIGVLKNFKNFTRNQFNWFYCSYCLHLFWYIHIYIYISIWKPFNDVLYKAKLVLKTHIFCKIFRFLCRSFEIFYKIYVFLKLFIYIYI